MKKRFSALSATFIFLGFITAQAQTLTLAECVRIALENNYSLRSAELQMRNAEQQIVLARSAWLPQIGSSFTFGKWIQGRRNILQDTPVGVDPTTGRYIYEQKSVTISQTERNNYGASIFLNQNIYDFGLTANAIRQAKALRNAYEHALLNTRHMVIANVKDKYFKVLMAMKLYDVYQEAVRHAEENLQYNETMMNVGLKSNAEIYQARVNLGEQKSRLINQKNAVEFAKAELNSAMGRAPDTPIAALEDVLAPVQADFTFEQAVEIALQRNEQLKMLEEQIKAAEYGVRSARAQYAPSIGARVSYNRDNDDITRVYTGKLDEDYTASIGAGINLDVFQGFANKARVEQQKIQKQQALEELKERKRLLVADINEFFLALQAYMDMIKINQENLNAYKENLRLQEEKRRVGAGTELEVMQAQLMVVQAQEALVSAQYNAQIAQAYLAAAIGIIE
ncbi:MAG: TolC family protein [candidate division KSB1 bacterium]|nr:TolC family protein [candidate division KSB1 bacterium]